MWLRRPYRSNGQQRLTALLRRCPAPGVERPTHPTQLTYTYCISDVIYCLWIHCWYNVRQIGHRIAQKWAVRWVSHGGPAKRTKRRPEPHAQPVASVRQRSGRRPLLIPRGCTTPAPRSDGSQLCDRTWEEKRYQRSRVPRDAMLTERCFFRLLAMASPDWMICTTY